MNKLLRVIKMSLETELAYKANLIIWRFRNLISLFVVFYLWSAVFSDPGEKFFGYDKPKILTYIFLVFVVKAVALSSKSIEVSGEIARGELSNYLIKPLNYFGYWFSKDIANKAINILFAVLEISLVLLLVKPEIYLQTNWVYLIISFFLILAAIIIYFSITFIVSTIPFWAPELGWGSHFLITVILVDFLSGSLFPLDILPPLFQKVLFVTPFPYLLYFPVQTYLGRMSLQDSVYIVAGAIFWIFGLYYVLKIVWSKGLRVYEAYGR